MKVFYIIMLVLFIMVGGILFNKVRVNEFTAEAIDKLYSIETDSNDFAQKTKYITDEILSELKKYEFSISQKKINTIRGQARLLIVQSEMNNFLDFEETRELLIAQLTEIDEGERISFSNII